MSPAEGSHVIKQIAADSGFDRAGVTRALPIGRAASVEQWIAAGYAGRMQYLERPERTDPRKLLEGARSVIVLACNYHQPAMPAPEEAPTGRVAMYAWGDDYHEIIKKKLWRLIDRLHEAFDEPFEARPCVDTAPVIERELSAAAGVGWIGKNTLVLHQDLGSYFFLAEIVTTLELAPDAPVPDRCGSCCRCLDACPTHAFPEPYVMDARRCISYLTIEHREDIAESLHEDMGAWVFGCDVCQDVCPYNQAAPVTTEPRFAAREGTPRPLLSDMLADDAKSLRDLRRRSAIRRAKPEMLRRNAAIAMRNAKAGACDPE